MLTPRPNGGSTQCLPDMCVAHAVFALVPVLLQTVGEVAEERSTYSPVWGSERGFPGELQAKLARLLVSFRRRTVCPWRRRLLTNIFPIEVLVVLGVVPQVCCENRDGRGQRDPAGRAAHAPEANSLS